MSYLPPQPVKSRKLRERYRQRRRRQLVHIALAALILIALVIVILLISFAVRSCSNTFGQKWAVSRQVQRGAEDDFADLVGKIRLKAEPVDWVASTNGLVFLNRAETENGEVNGPGIELSGVDYDSGKLMWEQRLDSPHDSLYSVGQYVIAVQLARTEPLRLDLKGISDSTGNVFWEQSLSNLTDLPAVAMGTDYFAIGFTRDDVRRLVLYDPASGAKLHTPRLNMTGLRRTQVSPALGKLFIAAWDNYFAYYHQNVTGVINGRDGKALQHYAAGDYLIDGIFDPASSSSFILVQEQTGMSLTHIAQDGSARNLKTFNIQAHHKLAVGDGQLLLAHNALGSSDTPQSIQLTTYEQSTGLPTGDWELPTGWLVDADYVAGEPGWFVIAISEAVDETGLPSGAGWLYILNLGWEEPILVDELKQPVLGALAFKGDCIVLERGGRILSLVAAGPFLKKIGKAKYPVLEAHLSSDAQHLVVSAMPELAQITGPTSPVEFLCFE